MNFFSHIVSVSRQKSVIVEVMGDHFITEREMDFKFSILLFFVQGIFGLKIRSTVRSMDEC